MRILPILAALSFAAPAAHATPTAELRLVCAGGAENGLCRALAYALIGHSAEAPQSVALVTRPGGDAPELRFVAEPGGPARLAGHLEWRLEGRRGQGPTVELWLDQGIPGPRVLAAFAATLLAQSRPPL